MTRFLSCEERRELVLLLLRWCAALRKGRTRAGSRTTRILALTGAAGKKPSLERLADRLGHVVGGTARLVVERDDDVS